MDNIYVGQIGHSQIDSFQNDALHEALLSAKAKANLIAKTMNVTLGKVVSVNETYQIINNQPGSYQFDNYQMEDRFYFAQSRARVGSIINFQKIKLSKTVVVKYEIQ